MGVVSSPFPRFDFQAGFGHEEWGKRGKGEDTTYTHTLSPFFALVQNLQRFHSVRTGGVNEYCSTYSNSSEAVGLLLASMSPNADRLQAK